MMPAADAAQLLSRSLVLPCPHGIHLRVAARIVTLANTFRSAIWLSSRTRSANAKSILALLELGVSEGDPITVTAKGPDAEQALEAVCTSLDRRAAACVEESA
jgi:phosphocarrier protein FPr/phosphocarrier protein